MVDLSAFENDIAPLDRLLRPIASRPVDISDPNWVGKLRAAAPLEEAGITSEAEAVLGRLLAFYSQSAEAEREAVRGLLGRYTAFRWAARLPCDPKTAEGFRSHLLHLSARDQGADARDEILLLRHLCQEAVKAGVETVPILEEVAALSSDVDKYGMGSMRTFLLHARRIVVHPEPDPG